MGFMSFITNTGNTQVFLEKDPCSRVIELAKEGLFPKAIEIAKEIIDKTVRGDVCHEIIKEQVKKKLFTQAVELAADTILDETLRGIVFYEIIEELIKNNQFNLARAIIDKMVVKSSKIEAIYLLFKNFIERGFIIKATEVIGLIDKQSKEELLLRFFIDSLSQNSVDQILKIIKEIPLDCEEEFSCNIFNELISLGKISQSIEVFNRLDLRKSKKDPREIICQELVKLVQRKKVDEAIELADKVIKEQVKGYLLYNILRILLKNNEMQKVMQIKSMIKDEEFLEQASDDISEKLLGYKDLEFGL